MVDIADLKSAGCEAVRVRIPLPAPIDKNNLKKFKILAIIYM